MKSELDLTILLPCLNEAETLEICILKARNYLHSSGLTGEVLVADNGSVDGSQIIATNLGARVLDVPSKGYGAALQSGINACNSKWVVMGDSDDSYALDKLHLFIGELELGKDLVIGNRFMGGIYPGAMPWLHRYIGNPVLSALGRTFFKVPIRDFHCGLRAFKLESIKKLNLSTTGMEFASEMIIKAALGNLSISEVPTTLQPDGRSRKPHLKTWSDGWRHLIFMLLASPRWLFFYPGLLLTLMSTIGFLFLLEGGRSVFGLKFGLNTYLLQVGGVLVGTQTLVFGILAKLFLTNYIALPKTRLITNFEKYFTLEKGIIGSGILFLLSLVGMLMLLNDWTGENFSTLSLNSSVKLSALIILTMCLSIQFMFTSFFIALLKKS